MVQQVTVQFNHVLGPYRCAGMSSFACDTWEIFALLAIEGGIVRIECITPRTTSLFILMNEITMRGHFVSVEADSLFSDVPRNT